VVAGSRADLEQPLSRPRLEDLAQALARDERVGGFDPEALRVRAGGRIGPPPERRAHHREARPERDLERRPRADHAPSEAGTISRMCRRASIRTGVVQLRPDPSRATSSQSRSVKNSWSRRFTWSDTRERYPSRGRVSIPSTR